MSSHRESSDDEPLQKKQATLAAMVFSKVNSHAVGSNLSNSSYSKEYDSESSDDEPLQKNLSTLVAIGFPKVTTLAVGNHS